MNLGIRRPLVLAPFDLPLTGVLDSFDRADETPLGTSSSGDVWGTTKWYTNFGSMGVVSNKCASSGLNGSQALGNNYGPNCEVYGDIATFFSGTPSVIRMMVRGAITTPGNANGYNLTLLDPDDRASGPGRAEILISRMDAGTQTFLAVGMIPTFADGDSVGLFAVGSTIVAGYKPSAGGWTAWLKVTDATYGAAGKIGLGVDDPVAIGSLGGGTR